MSRCERRSSRVAAVTVARQRLGRRVEAAVAERLAADGWSVVARNARTAEVRGEIDLVAWDGDALVFVEVKARKNGSHRGPETPAMAVGRRKRAKLRSLAVAWLRDNAGHLPPHRELRFDVVGIRVDAAGRPTEWEHLRGAF
jgi:putative endonuclease